MLLWVTSALAADTGCDEGRLARLPADIRGLPPGQIVAESASALAEACRGWSDVLETAGDAAEVSPERRRALDLELAKHDTRWLESCPDGERVLNESMRMTRIDGRAHVWDGCNLERLQVFGRDEWVNGLDGLLVLPMAASVLLPEVGVDFEVSRVVVRGLAGLPPPLEAAKRELAMPSNAELAAADEVARVTPAALAPTAPLASDASPTPALEEPAAGPPSLVTVPPAFLEGGQAKVHWSSASLVAGGTCVTRIRVGPTGEMAKITFLECADALQADVTRAAQQSRYRVAMAGEYPATGAFRTRWTVPGSE